MSKMTASASGDRHGDARARAPHEGSAERAPAPDTALDSEMLDLVKKFEQTYAQLAPAAEAPPQAAPPAQDDPFPEFAAVFADAPPVRPAPAESARVLTMPRREPELGSPAPASRTRAATPEPDVDLDEAMAILRASENRGRPVPEPGVEPDDAVAPAPQQRFTERAFQPQPRLQPRAERPSSIDWATKAHTVRTIAMAAAVIALAIGAAAGYFLGRTPPAKSPARVIESSKLGGTQLRLDRELQQK